MPEPKTRTKKSQSTEPTDKLLPKLSLFFFDRKWLTLVTWVALLTFGIASYTTLLKREGFPSVNLPIVIVSASSQSDAATLDNSVAKPLSKIALDQPGVSSVNVSTQNNFVQSQILYSESTDAEDAKSKFEAAVRASDDLPEDVQITFSAPYFGATGGSAEKIDATISLFADNNDRSTQELEDAAKQAVEFLNKQNHAQVDRFFVQSPYSEITNPLTGEATTVQRTFDRYAQANDQEFKNSIIIGVSGVEGFDAIELDREIESSLAALNRQSAFEGFDAAISASFAPTIDESISELQRVLIEGLIAVLIIGSIVIAVRASLITVIAMVTVIAITLALLFVVGYSLNVITLFALILGLSLIVDDTIIMVEAIDAARRKHTSARTAVREASRKISRAMVAATLTAAFSFAPLLFVSGILGTFIRAIPFTIISSLLISLFVALIFIPFFARYILLGKKQLGKKGKVVEPAANIEHKIADFVGKPMLWSKGSRLRQVIVASSALFVSLLFIVGAGFLFTKVTFNIFPASKDTNQIAVAITYPSGTTIQQAETRADEIDAKVRNILGDNLHDASYYGTANNQSATLNVNLTPYSKRGPTAKELSDQIARELDNYPGANIASYQLDIGPPSSSFIVNIDATNRDAATRVSNDIVSFLEKAQLKRPNGEVARFTDASADNTDIFKRVDGQPVLSVSAGFDGTDTSTLTVLAQTAVDDEFNASKLASYGLDADAISYSLGQETENQNSFNSLVLAFPVVLLAIFILLAIQFRSLLQPLLIFMAIPFSLFGVAFGLYVTDNAISFFSLLGFFALIGLSVKNTILLTDYANQARRAGMGPIDAAVAAIAERFRPLIATSVTAIVSLIPLAITSPFWEGLAYTLIFGLASSTILVVLVFPYYYLIGEFLRNKTRQAARRIFRRSA